MKKTLFQKVICLILSVTTLFGVVGITAMASGSGGALRGTNRDTASTLEEMQALVGVSSYDEYISEYGNSYVPGLPTLSVSDITATVPGSNGVVTGQSEVCQNSYKENQANWENFGDNWANTIYLPASGSTTWNFHVPDGAASYYYIKINYFSCITSESSISSIERKLFIDGKAQFKESNYITLDKSWKYDNITTAAPVDTTEPDGTKIEYELRDDGYYKIVTDIKGGKKVVTTYAMTQDINGNSMAPGIVQDPSWSTYYCQDTTGYYQGYMDGNGSHQKYFCFYLSNGSHQITLAAEREPVIIKSIEFVPYDPATNQLKTFADVKAEYDAAGYKPATGEMTVIQAEFPDFVSDASVYPTNDNTSPATYPVTSKSQLYNVIGENSFNNLGQWAAYKFKVNESGLYKFSVRYLQKALEGMYVCRTIKLSGGHYGDSPTVPYLEAYDVQFDYSKDWQSEYAKDSNGNVFEFYFEEGVEYTLYLECSLGSLKELIQRVETSLNNVNECYLRVLQLTGSSPDAYRDYSFMEIMPDVMRSFLEEAIELMDIKKGLEELCGTSGSHTATLETVARLLDTMGSNEGDDIAANMSNLKSNLGTLGTWINDSKKGLMMLDSISVCPADAADKSLPKAKANFFKAAWFEITSFIYSFFTDYEAMGLTEVPDKDAFAIDVWLAMGRDQSNIWRSMIDAQNGFTDRTGYAVNLKLVTAGTLLPSILSGKGPDVYMGLAAATVINYAIRDAIMGVSGNVDKEGYDNEVFNTTYYTYKDASGKREITTEYRGEEGLVFTSHTFDDYVEANFVDAAMDTITLLGVSYGLPQTMAFSMLFYRMDVLAELGQEVPETWSQLLSLLPVLQTNNMSIGVSYTLALEFMLYQKGGNMWKYYDIPEYAGSQIGLDSDVALESFEYVCRLFSDYSFPVSYDAANRFRTGEMPILVGSYEDLYNKLVVYATEIEGLWEFSPLPGSETGEYDENGREIINYDSLANVTASIMLHGCEGEEQFAAWEYMQWQTSAETQANYGNRMVALIGPSAKYETANINAIKDLSWTADERAAIEDQIKHMSSVVNYPGSYIIARYLKFAFLDAVNGGADPIDALSEYIDAMNAEITRKREEFGLNTLAPDEIPPNLPPDYKHT